MLDTKTAVCLCPQWFHNHFTPDFADNTNTNFMFRLMPYYFGAGCCFITGAPPCPCPSQPYHALDPSLFSVTDTVTRAT